MLKASDHLNSRTFFYLSKQLYTTTVLTATVFWNSGKLDQNYKFWLNIEEWASTSMVTVIFFCFFLTGAVTTKLLHSHIASPCFTVSPFVYFVYVLGPSPSPEPDQTRTLLSPAYRCWESLLEVGADLHSKHITEWLNWPAANSTPQIVIFTGLLKAVDK